MKHTQEDIAWMTLAIEEAKTAFAQDEVPIGAIIVKDNTVIARAHNQKEQHQVTTHHAEILAIETACKKLQTWRLQDCTLYTSLEPCIMCAGAIYQSRIARVVYGAKDPKGGALGSLYDISKDRRLNHKFKCDSGILSDTCSKLLKEFFELKRQ